MVSGASRRARQGRRWVELAELHGVQGVIVGPEVTWSKRAGWHYHQHLAVIVTTAEPEAAEAAGHAVLARYLSAVKAAGGRALPQGQNVQHVWRREDLQSYIGKGSAAWEVGAAGVGKVANGRGLTPWDLAIRAAEGDGLARLRFAEYVEAMPGTRSCVVTASIAAKLGIEPEDDPQGEMEDEPEDEVLGEVSRGTWHLLLRRGRVADVLAAAHAGVEWSSIASSIEVWAAFKFRPPDVHAQSG
jgi:hypothetical protein